MNFTDSLNIKDLDIYLNKIFDLQLKILDKDLHIMKLQFALEIEAELLKSFKKIYGIENRKLLKVS